MPANLPPQYIALKRQFEISRDIDEKIELLEEMLAIMPKHKGTNKLLGENRSKLAALRKEAARSKSSKRRRHDDYHIPKQGAAQVIIIGFPNVGKSQILVRLTHAETEVAPYPFTTGKPVVGMMPYEDISIQLIDTSPISEDYIDPHLPELVRRAELILLIADIGSDETLEQIEVVTTKLAESRIKLIADEDSYDEEFICKKTILVANKEDLEGSKERLDILRELFSQKFPIFTISAETGRGLEELKRQIFQALKIIRIYTKAVGRKADLNDPVILKSGSTVLDAAAEIHKEFFENLKFAKIWGDGKNKYDGQQVSRDHPLEDGNIVEFHIAE